MPLTYCLNVHPGESWEENLATLRSTVLEVRDMVSPGRQFGLGIRLSAAAAATLAEPGRIEELKGFLSAESLSVFTVNGFPFGKFHGGPVKENVYAPDWRSLERRDYTNQIATVLAALIPEGSTASISTVPGSWKGWIRTTNDVDGMVEHLIDAVTHCASIAEKQGRDILLTLEPEPGCFLETTAETVGFFKDHLFRRGATLLGKKLSCAEASACGLIRHHLGVCLDTCHVALQFEDPAESMRLYAAAGIRVPKIQISSALWTAGTPEALEELRRFQEPVYLHQVKARTAAGEILGWRDLPEALTDLPSTDAEEVRVHFHVPLPFTGSGALRSTSALLTREFMQAISRDPGLHLEIETYTWDVLPPELRTGSLAESIASEFRWVNNQSASRY